MYCVYFSSLLIQFSFSIQDKTFLQSQVTIYEILRSYYLVNEILISRLLNGSLCICVLRASVFHVVKWYLIFPDFLPFREPFMTKKTVQRRSLTVVRPRSLDSVVIEAAGEFGRRLFKPQSFPRIGWGCSDAYRTGMTTQYVSVQCNVCLPYGRPGTWN